jgi:hypothetical protein
MSLRRFLVIAPSALIVLLLLTTFATNVAFGQGDRGRGNEFRATLNGYNETPSISTVAQGQFTARLVNPTTLQFEMRWTGLEGGAATVSHIHLGQRHVAGGVVAFLCGGGNQPACPANGVLTGTVTAANVVDRPAQGITAGEFAEVLRAMQSGAGYVNVHNSIYQSGEIRGQIRNGGDFRPEDD